MQSLLHLLDSYLDLLCSLPCATPSSLQAATIVISDSVKWGGTVQDILLRSVFVVPI